MLRYIHHFSIDVLGKGKGIYIDGSLGRGILIFIGDTFISFGGLYLKNKLYNFLNIFLTSFVFPMEVLAMLLYPATLDTARGTSLRPQVPILLLTYF